MKAHLTFTVIAPHPPNWFVIWELYSKLSLIKLKFKSKEPFNLLLFLFKKEMFLFEVGKYWSSVSHFCVLRCVRIDLCKACTSTKSTKMLYGSLWDFLFVCWKYSFLSCKTFQLHFPLPPLFPIPCISPLPWIYSLSTFLQKE